MRFCSSTVTALAALGGIVSANPVPYVKSSVACQGSRPEELSTDHSQHTRPCKAKGLNDAFVAQGREYIGTALTIRDDKSESEIINNPVDFGSVTPENAMKWESTQPSRGNYTFDGADAIAEYAEKNNQLLRCHTLVWHSQLPSWVSDGGFSNETLIEIMSDHIHTVAGRYKGQCKHWDVVNEALEEDGSYRDSVFYNVIGEAFIPIAFRIAAEVDPDAKLYYNDYNLEYDGPKAKAARKIVELVQSYGVKIDGVGLQGHLVAESTPTQDKPTPSQKILEKNLRLYTELGVDVAYTEIDIRMLTPATEEKLQKQAEIYARVVRACLAVERCVGITLWGVSDKYSWVPETFPGEGAALLWNGNYKKKPAYQGTLKALQG